MARQIVFSIKKVREYLPHVLLMMNKIINHLIELLLNAIPKYNEMTEIYSFVIEDMKYGNTFWWII